ncbi:hypothetical protein BC835DRAFT_1282714, partial [Cytidiella melzeri]
LFQMFDPLLWLSGKGQTVYCEDLGNTMSIMHGYFWRLLGMEPVLGVNMRLSFPHYKRVLVEQLQYLLFMA